MARRHDWAKDRPDFAKEAAAKLDRIKGFVSKLKERQAAPKRDTICVTAATTSSVIENATESSDFDFNTLNFSPNDDLTSVVQLIDTVIASNHILHAALLWPHIPPRTILPWIVREVSRGRRERPVRTLFLNMSRSALQALSGVEAKTAALKKRGVYRSGQDDIRQSVAEISADAHFFMFLGDASIGSVPVSSIVPHAVAINDGVYWRDFDEKALKGFKRYFPSARLQSIHKYLDILTSGAKSPAFAFLLPSHFEGGARKAALLRLPGQVDLVVIDLGTQALESGNVSEVMSDLINQLEQCGRLHPRQVLITTDCPLRFSFITASLKHRRNPGFIGTKIISHRLVWGSRDRGFEAVPPLELSERPLVETIGSQECIVASHLWAEAHKLDRTNPLASALIEGASALKGMTLTAAGADAVLKPYGDTHDAYHRIKRERHSYEPHYAKAMALINEGHGGAWREKIERDLQDALALANNLRQETQLLRYLKRTVIDPSIGEDILVVLRHAEDAQQTNDLLLDFLTAPGNLSSRAPNLRVTTTSRYPAELAIKSPTAVIWAASANAGMRAFIGDSFTPRVFRLVVAGHDALALRRSLDSVLKFSEFAVYRNRVELLRSALPWISEELGGVREAVGLDLDKPRAPLPFEGQGYLLLDGYGPLSASPGSLLYVLDPATQQLHPREARAIEVGDSVFAMSTAIREEIEALLREKDEGGRTFEQALVDQYKAIVKAGTEKLSRKEGRKATGARIHELLFEQNPNLPPIGPHAIDYWLQAADRLDVDTPFAASDPLHLEAFLKLMGAGVLARQMSDAVRVVRHALRRDGHTNRALFDRLLLDPDSLIQTAQSVTFERLQGLREEALENVFTVLESHLEKPAATSIDRHLAKALVL